MSVEIFLKVTEKWLENQKKMKNYPFCDRIFKWSFYMYKKIKF